MGVRILFPNKTKLIYGRGLLIIRNILKYRSLRDISILTLVNLFTAALGVIQGILVARWLGPHWYGVAALVMSYPNFLFTFLDARSHDASVKYLAEFSVKGEIERVVAVCKLGYTIDISISLLTLGLVAVTAKWAEAHIIHTTGMAWLIILYAASFVPRSLTGTSRAILVTLGRFTTLAWAEAINTVLRTTLILSLVLGGWGVIGIILGNAIGAAAQGAVLSILVYPAVKQTWGNYRTSGSWQSLNGRRNEVLRFIFYSDLTTLLGLAVTQFDLIALGYFRGPMEAGYYRLAKSIGAATGNLVGPLQSVSYPRFSQLWGAGLHTELQQSIRRYALWVGVPLGGLALASLPLLPSVISMLAGEAYLPAIPATQILFFGHAIYLGLFWVRPFYFATGKVGFWLKLGIINCVFTIVAYPTLAPLWGAQGVALCRAASVILQYGPATIRSLHQGERS